MRNKNIMSSLTGGTKVFLLICLAATFICDLTVTLVIFVMGAGVYFTFPLLFSLVDAVFLIQAIFSNFRFSYTIKHLVIYVVCSAFLFLFTLIFNIFGGQKVFSDVAAAFVIAVHALAIAGTIVCYLYAAKRIKGNRAVQTAVAAIFTLLYAAVIVLYAISLFGTGYFGQGGINTRPLTYRYDETSDTYEVTGVINGNATQIYVPAEFNGKKISKVSSSVFNSWGIYGITLDCAADVEFTDDFREALYNDQLLTVYTTRDKTEIFKQKFYDIYKNDAKCYSALQLANAVAPAGLKDDEVFITFAYDGETFDSFAKDAPLPTWIGKKGDVFDASCFGDIPYAKYSDRTDDGHLLWNYENNKKYVLSPFSAMNEYYDTVTLNGSAITQNFKAVPVKFERVYKIFPGESNDTVHTTDLDFGYSEVGGEKLPYKLAVEDYADNILSNFKRDGYVLTWWYSTSDYPKQRSRFETLKGNVLGRDYNESYPEFTIYPQWEMLDPEVTLSSDGVNDTYTYGDSAKISASAKSDVKDVYFEYSWWDSGSWMPTEELPYLSFPKITVNDDSNYSVSVTAKSTDSSLTASTTQYLRVTVNRRSVYLDWEYPANKVFNGEEKYLTCSIKDGCILDGDGVSVYNNSFYNIEAGTYPFTAYLTGSESVNYKIENATAYLTIEKAPLTAVWNEDLTYNSSLLSPEVTVTGTVANANDVWVTSNSFENAGPHKFTATLGGSDAPNYYLTNPTKTIEIKPYGVTVNWRINGTEGSLVYNGKPYSVTASATGVRGRTLNVNVDGEFPKTITDANTYNLTAAIYGPDADNYVITEGLTHTYVIEPYSASVKWSNSTLYYNGGLQHPAITITGVGGVLLDADAECNGKDAGTGYTCTVTGILPSDRYRKENYVLTDIDLTRTYSIEKAAVKVSWGSLELVYNGKPQRPEAYIVGFGDDGIIPLDNVTPTDAVNVGTYHAVADQSTQSDERLKNYTIVNNGTDFKIIKRTLTYKATDVTIYQGDELPAFTYTPSGFIDGSTPGIIVSDIKISVEGFKGEVGKYVNFIIITGKVSGEGKENYNVVFEYGTLTVLPRED